MCQSLCLELEQEQQQEKEKEVYSLIVNVFPCLMESTLLSTSVLKWRNVVVRLLPLTMILPFVNNDVNTYP